MLKKFTFLLLLIVLHLSVTGQDPYYTKDRNLPCVSKKFSIFVHIVKDSLGRTGITAEEISKHLMEANKAFEPICISFDFCISDTIADYSYGYIDDFIEVGLLTSRFQKKRRINLYFVDSLGIVGPNSYSNFNGINKPDSCFMLVPKNGIGLVHELGHSFGLLHTFETRFGKELVDGSNCLTAGDFVCDTPADPNARPDNNCYFVYPLPDDNNDYYKTEVGNYMSHFFCAHCFFTTRQYEIMASNYLNSNIKLW